MACDPAQATEVATVLSRVLFADGSGETVERICRQNAAVIPALAALLEDADANRRSLGAVVLHRAATRPALLSALLDPGAALIPRILLLQGFAPDGLVCNTSEVVLHALVLLIESSAAAQTEAERWGALAVLVDIVAAGLAAGGPEALIALRVIYHMTGHGRQSACHLAVASGLIPLLTAVLSRTQQKKDSTTEFACALVHRLSQGSAPRTEALAAGGVLPPLVRTLLDHTAPDNVLYNSAVSISSMAMAVSAGSACLPEAPPAVVRRLMDAGALEALDMLSRRPNTARSARMHLDCAVVEALCALAMSSASVLRRILARDGVSSTLLARVCPSKLVQTVTIVTQLIRAAALLDCGFSEAFIAGGVVPRLTAYTALALKPLREGKTPPPKYFNVQLSIFNAFAALIERPRGKRAFLASAGCGAARRALHIFRDACSHPGVTYLGTKAGEVLAALDAQ